MPAPLLNQLLPVSRHEREIDNHWHLQQIATSKPDLLEHRLAWFAQQRDGALEIRSTISHIAHTLDDVAESLATISDDTAEIRDLAAETRDLTALLLEEVTEGFDSVVDQLLEQHETLRQISDAVVHQHEAHVQELLAEAVVALERGRRTTSSRDRVAEFADASRLLSEVLADPIGSRNDLAWFEIGWLRWKVDNDLAQAELAFYNAARHSRPRADLFHIESLRHLAAIQYFLKQYTEAYATVTEARLLRSDYDILFDAARYAAKAGRRSDALALVEQCIDLRPYTSETILNDPDFVGITPEISSLVNTKTAQARLKASTALVNCAKAIDTINEAARRAEYDTQIPSADADQIARWRGLISRASFPGLVRIAKLAAGAEHRLLMTAVHHLTARASQLRRTLAEIESKYNPVAIQYAVPPETWKTAQRSLTNVTAALTLLTGQYPTVRPS